MLLLSSINFLIIISIFGYSYIFKRLIFGRKFTFITNLDFIYGLIFLYFLSLIIHLLIPLGVISNLIIVFGLLVSFFLYLKDRLKISLLKYFLIIFAFSMIAYYGKNNVDSPMYHLQVIKWLTEFKLTFGLANLGYRLGVNYPWYSLLSILNFDYGFFSNKYYFSLIFFSFIFYELLNQSKLNKSLIFLSIILIYLLSFSIIHPYNYGVILNHFGNPEKDIFNMLLFFFSIYIFLKIHENENNNNFELENLISIFFISISLLLMQMPIYGMIIFLILFTFYKFISLKNYIPLFIFLTLIFIFWSLKSLSLNGCLIFPIAVTCVETDWTINLDTLNYMVDEMKRWCRSLPSLDIFNDRYKTIETFQWLKPWFKDYYLKTAIHQINTFIFIISIFIIIYLAKFKKFFLFKFEQILILTILFVNITCLIMIPEIRYYWGPHISLSSILLVFLISMMNINFLNNKKIYILGPFFLLCLFILVKVSPMLSLSDFVKLPIRDHNYTFKTKIGNYKGYDIYTNNWQCADIKEICVNIPKKEYNFQHINSYLFINNNLNKLAN